MRWRGNPPAMHCRAPQMAKRSERRHVAGCYRHLPRSGARCWNGSRLRKRRPLFVLCAIGWFGFRRGVLLGLVIKLVEPVLQLFEIGRELIDGTERNEEFAGGFLKVIVDLGAHFI